MWISFERHGSRTLATSMQRTQTMDALEQASLWHMSWEKLLESIALSLRHRYLFF